LLRQYFPKGINFDLVDDARIREVEEELNDRPRLCLSDRSPKQLMARWHQQLATI
jgi:transposase, IS30 family